MSLQRQNNVEFPREKTSKTVLRRFASYGGEAYNHLTFAFECICGWMLDPLPFLILRCVQWTEKTRRPTKPVEQKFRKAFSSGSQEKACSLYLSDLSFFDSFESNQGVPVHYFDRASSVLEREGTGSDGAGSSTSPTKSKSDPLKNKKKSVFGKSTGGDDPVITGCVFSYDGRRFATCYASGDVIVWDAIRGGVDAKPIWPPISEILAISFSPHNSSILQIVTQDCKLYKGKVEDTLPYKEDISSFWRNSEHEEVELHTADFFDNGCIVVCSSIPKHSSRRTIEFVVADISNSSGELENAIIFEVAVENDSVVSGVEISPDGKGLLVATFDNSSRKGQCFLWPSFREDSAHYDLPYGGTLGNWSSNSELALTWTIPDGLNQEDKDDSCALVWNVKELRNNTSNVKHFADDPARFKSPFGDRVFWCRLVLDAKGRDRLIMALVDTTTRFLFWDVRSRTHTHTIETGIETEGMMSASAKGSVDSQVDRKSVGGLSSMALTMDRSKFGAVWGKPSRLRIWDAASGVQSLELSPHGSRANEFKDGADVLFSPTNGKIAMVGEHSAMVFAPPTPSACPSNNNGTMESPTIEIDTLQGGRDTRDTKYKLLFSGEGNSLGVLRIGLNKMQVHRFSNNTICTIKANPKNDDGIVDFCVSMDGEYVVTNSTRAKIYVWRCKGEEGVHVGQIGEDVETMALGITRDGKEIVVCSKKGELMWFSAANEDERKSNESPIHEHVFQRGDCRIPLLSSEQNFVRSGTVDSFIGQHQEPSTFVRAHTMKVDGHEVQSCRISTSCEKGVRLLDGGHLEVWNLNNKKLEQTVKITIPVLSHSLTQDLLPLSGTRPSFDLANNESADREGDGLPFLASRRVIVPEREGFLVAAEVASSTTLFQGPMAVDGPSRVGQDIQRDKDSISIIDAHRHQRQLKGKDLHPQKGLAISADGRHQSWEDQKSTRAIHGLVTDLKDVCIRWTFNADASRGMSPSHLRPRKRVQIRCAISKQTDSRHRLEIRREISEMSERLQLPSHDAIRPILEGYSHKKTISLKSVLDT